MELLAMRVLSQQVQRYSRIVLIASLALNSIDSLAEAFSQQKACARLINAAEARHLAIESSNGQYRCEPYIETKRYFVFQLHYAGEQTENSPTSTLAGYYAVRKADHSVLTWNFGNDVPGKTIYMQANRVVNK
jgi:hypothetical protein